MNPSVFRALRYGASFLLLLSLFPIRLPADALDLGRLEADYQRSDQFSKSAFRTSVSQEDLEQQLIPYLRSGQLKRHISKNVGNGDTRFGTRLKQLLALQRVKGPSTVFSALQVLEAPIHTRRVSLRLTPYGPPGPLLDALARQGGRGEWVSGLADGAGGIARIGRGNFPATAALCPDTCRSRPACAAVFRQCWRRIGHDGPGVPASGRGDRSGHHRGHF